MGLNQGLLNELLFKYGEKKHSVKKAHNKNDVSDILNAFGGMGSINDIYICKANGHLIDPPKEAEVNMEIQRLLESIYKKCQSGLII